MIVHPDFLDHWKTKTFTELTGDPLAPMMVLRLWGYCQIQKKSVFENAPNLKSICRSSLPTETLLDHFINSGFLRRGDQNELIVHDWEQCNRILRNSWNNGQKGGHPSKFKPTGYPRDTHRQPTGSYVQKNRIEKVGYPRADNKSHTDQPTKDSAGAANSEESRKPLTEEERLANIKKFGEQVGSITNVLKGKISETEIIR